MPVITYRFLKIHVFQEGQTHVLYATVSEKDMESVRKALEDDDVKMVKIQSQNGQVIYVKKSELSHIIEGDYNENQARTVKL